MNTLIMNYSYRGKGIKVSFSSENYYKKITRLFNSLAPIIQKVSSINNESYYIEINRETIYCCLNNSKCVFNILNATDIYVIIYLFLYSIWSENNEYGIHSVAIKKGNDCVLIIGDFGAGKTTLSLEFEQIGWSILSADQSVIRFENNRVIFSGGSKYVSYNDFDFFLSETPINNCVVNNIVVINGLAQNGDVKIKREMSRPNLIKKVWNSMVWPWNIYLFSEKTQADFQKIEYFQRLSSEIDSFTKICFWEVRGDPKRIAKKIDDLRRFQ